MMAARDFRAALILFEQSDGPGKMSDNNKYVLALDVGTTGVRVRFKIMFSPFAFLRAEKSKPAPYCLL